MYSKCILLNWLFGSDNENEEDEELMCNGIV